MGPLYARSDWIYVLHGVPYMNALLSVLHVLMATVPCKSNLEIQYKVFPKKSQL